MVDMDPDRVGTHLLLSRAHFFVHLSYNQQQKWYLRGTTGPKDTANFIYSEREYAVRKKMAKGEGY